jgi:predicted phosphohydrolase
MEKFGSRWQNYTEKINKNWRAVITDDDTVVIPGDISWALRLEEAREDLAFLNSLPGKKLIGKGNHDFWWSTAAKMNALMEKFNIHSIRTLYNNAYLVEDAILCGTRGWFVEESQQNTVGTVDYARIVNREVIRLRLSLDAAKKLKQEDGRDLPILVFLHFPPVWNGFVCQEIVDALHEYGIKTCYFGHIHGAYYAPRTQVYEGIEMVLCAADALNFAPMPIYSADF